MTVDRRDGLTENGSELVVFQQHEVPEAVRALSTIADPDYVDLFTLVTSDASSWSPEQWARAAFEDVAGLAGQFIWRALLGLRLERRPSHVAGWTIVDRGDNWLTLEARSWMLTGNLVIQVEREHLSLATFLRYDKPMGKRVWATLSAKHRKVAPGLLRDAHRVRQAGSR
ncbi:hypothetical protein ACFQZZ_03370 [Nocardia sp. GCM10030253]|uniref:hypothetical protein n=1 Tax=Nocardia sp. GCM10030253 TaxID=3273404 RepID=UPI0036457839